MDQGTRLKQLLIILPLIQNFDYQSIGRIWKMAYAATSTIDTAQNSRSVATSQSNKTVTLASNS